MKLIKYGKQSLAFVMMGIATLANAEIIHQDLSQENKNFDVKIQKGDSISVDFNLERYPIHRQHEWFSYVLKCETSEKSRISYPLKGQQKTANGQILLNNNDGQLICSELNGKWCVDNEIDINGTFTIENNAGKDEWVTCKLYNKIGK